MLRAAREALQGRLLHQAAELAQQPLNVPCRMFSTSGAISALGRWHRIVELFDLPQPETSSAGGESQPAKDGLASAGSEDANQRPSVDPVHTPDQELDQDGVPLTEEETRELILAHKRAADSVLKHLKGEFPPPQPVRNLAGEGRTAWALLAHDEKSGEEWWELDMTGGRVPEIEKNAQMSRDAKELMVWMHTKGFSVAQIAEHFRVRQQRVMAIIALHKIDQDREAAGEVMHHAFDEIMEGGPARAGNGLDGNDGYYDCDEVVGSGERHVKILPRAPHYEARHRARDPDFDWTKYEEKLAEKEENELVQEFSERLLYNMGEVGKSLKRNVNKSHRPKRPKQGFALLVKPLDRPDQTYVAEASGARRELTNDEAFLQHRRRIRRRRKLYPS